MLWILIAIPSTNIAIPNTVFYILWSPFYTILDVLLVKLTLHSWDEDLLSSLSFLQT